MFTPVMINCTVTANLWREDGSFLATKQQNEPFFIETSMENYETDDLLTTCTAIFNYISHKRSQGAMSMGLKYHIRVENINAPPPPTGALVQAKYQLDRTFSDQELSTSVAQDMVNTLKNDLTYAISFTSKNPLATNTPLAAFDQPYGVPLQSF